MKDQIKALPSADPCKATGIILCRIWAVRSLFACYPLDQFTLGIYQHPPDMKEDLNSLQLLLLRLNLNKTKKSKLFSYISAINVSIK